MTQKKSLASCKSNWSEVIFLSVMPQCPVQSWALRCPWLSAEVSACSWLDALEGSGQGAAVHFSQRSVLSWTQLWTRGLEKLVAVLTNYRLAVWVSHFICLSLFFFPPFWNCWTWAVPFSTVFCEQGAWASEVGAGSPKLCIAICFSGRLRKAAL